MLKPSLAKTNPYLRNPRKRREMFEMTVYTSTEIEGVKLNRTTLKDVNRSPTRATPIRGSVKSSESRR